MSRWEATLEASRLRLRPIVMTSFAFILGVVPLAIAAGAGAEMRRALGVAVFAGMLGVTLFGIFLTPVFFYVLQGLSEMRLFASGAVRRVGSPAVGGLTGFAVGFLLARPTSTTKPICVKMLMSVCVTNTPVSEPRMHIGTTRMTASGSDQLSYCAASTRKTNMTASAKTNMAVLPASSCK